MRAHTFMTLMRMLPKSALSTVIGMATRAPVPKGLHQIAIRCFVKHYKVNLDEALEPVEDYPTFAHFFTRRLKKNTRSIDEGAKAVVSPVDATLSQVGHVQHGQCLQAKNIHFSVSQLLGDVDTARCFEGGSFATLYLSPRDYHRFHAPVSGTITGFSYLPGALWPVNPASVSTCKALFAINERLVTFLETSAGKLACVAVGATCVARIRASYDAIITHTGGGKKHHTYPHPIPIAKGDEMGMFEMGSTIILLFAEGRVAWDEKLKPNTTVYLGERIGILR